MPRKTIPSLSRLRRTPEAVVLTGLSRRTLYRLAEDGRLNVYKVGSATYWSVDELDGLVQRRRAIA